MYTSTHKKDLAKYCECDSGFFFVKKSISGSKLPMRN